jgi:hypothetical protein
MQTSREVGTSRPAPDAVQREGLSIVRRVLVPITLQPAKIIPLV